MIFDAFQSTALAGVESLINKALAYDPATLNKLGELSDKVLQVNCSFPPLNFYVLHSDSGLDLMQNYQGEADTQLAGNALALATLAVSRNQTSLAGSGVEVTGDQELLADMQAILTELDVDWETALAQLIGDVPAYAVGNSLRAGSRFGDSAREQVTDAVTEFAKQESQWLPTTAEVEQFSSDVRLLRADTDRLQARLDACLSQVGTP